MCYNICVRIGNRDPKALMPKGFRTLSIGNLKHERQGVFLMQEIWKDIPGYEGKYQISNLGNVMSLHFKRSATNKKLLTPVDNNHGYFQVMLRDNGNDNRFRIHRLVAEAFVPNPENKPVVNHIDGNTKNNRADNLEWVTQRENIIHGCQYGKIKPPTFLGLTGSKNPLSKTILQINPETNSVVNEFIGMNEASRITKICVSSICACCKGKVKTAGGYIWKYKDE